MWSDPGRLLLCSALFLRKGSGCEGQRGAVKAAGCPCHRRGTSSEKPQEKRVQPRPALWGQVKQYVLTPLTDTHVVAGHSQDPLLLRASSVSPQCTAQTLPKEAHCCHPHSSSPSQSGAPTGDLENISSAASLPLYQPCISCRLADQDMFFLLTVMRSWRSTNFCCFMTFYFYQPTWQAKCFQTCASRRNCLQDLFLGIFLNLTRPPPFFAGTGPSPLSDILPPTSGLQRKAGEAWI